MRVLLSGGAGFIGTHIVDLLLARGHEEAIMDSLSTGKNESLRGSSGLDLPPEYGNAKPSEQPRSSVDAAAAGRALSWRPKVGVAAGLRETLGFFGAVGSV